MVVGGATWPSVVAKRMSLSIATTAAAAMIIMIAVVVLIVVVVTHDGILLIRSTSMIVYNK